jgi:hypothetical protein
MINNEILNTIYAIGGISTFFAAFFAAWQLMLIRQQTMASFEDHIDEQYRLISKSLPVDVLIGLETDFTDQQKYDIREDIFNYFDLSNEQIEYRKNGRVSKSTWGSWSKGMKLHLNKKAFFDIYSEVKDLSDFSNLDRLINESFEIDPKDWKNTNYNVL